MTAFQSLQSLGPQNTDFMFMNKKNIRGAVASTQHDPRETFLCKDEERIPERPRGPRRYLQATCGSAVLHGASWDLLSLHPVP